MAEPAIAFSVSEQDGPAVEVRVNFGVFAGRHVTPAEIDVLAGALARAVPAFAIVAEERHEFAGAVEAAIHQVRIEVARDILRGDPEALGEQLVAAAEDWARDCIAERHAEI